MQLGGVESPLQEVDLGALLRVRARGSTNCGYVRASASMAAYVGVGHHGA